MKELVFCELTQKQKRGEKGKTIVYTSLGMADYLLPEAQLTVREKTDMFSLRCQMNENPCNFGEKIQCQMGCSELPACVSPARVPLPTKNITWWSPLSRYSLEQLLTAQCFLQVSASPPLLREAISNGKEKKGQHMGIAWFGWTPFPLFNRPGVAGAVLQSPS